MSIVRMAATDVTDFITAQNELRSGLGAVAQFGVPNPPQWPAGTKINPDTGEPYDATVVQQNAPYTVICVTALVIEKKGSPMRPQADQGFSPSGLRDGMDIILDVAVADYERVREASMFTVEGEDFSVVERKPFTISNITYRYLVYGQQR